MQPFLRSIITAIVSGLLCMVVAIVVLMQLGRVWHNSYEHYGQYPFLFLLPGVIGFILPSVIAWTLRRSP